MKVWPDDVAGAGAGHWQCSSNSQVYHSSLLERKRGSKHELKFVCLSFLSIFLNCAGESSKRWKWVWFNLCEQLEGMKWERWPWYPVCEKVNRPCLDVSEKGELWHSDFYIFPWQPRECVVCSWQPTSTPHQVVACRTQQTNQQCQQNKCERPQNKITRKKSDV